MRLRLILFALLPLFAVGPAWARSATSQAAVDLQLTDRPHAVRTDAGVRLIYELHLANPGDEALRLRRLEVTDEDGRVLATFTGEQLERRLAPAGGKPGHALPAGGRAVLYLEWTAPAACPRVLAHVLTYTAGADTQASVRGGRTTVSCEAGAPLGPPLRGGPWIAIHYAGWPNGHRRVFTTVDGKARIPGRFAIDWVRVDAAGHLAQGDPDIPAHALGYGADVLAVADATVASVRDGMPEAARVSANPHHALQDEAGNYVVLRLDDGRYAFYEHLRPGSVTVKPGQRVRRGEVLGALGFTGASTGPHLHFHVADGPSTIGEEGRPFQLERFDLLGRYVDPARLGKAAWSPRRKGEAMRRSGEWPSENAVVCFPE
jgi:hypothetical protein